MSEIAVSSMGWVHKPRSLYFIAVVLFALCVMPPAALPQDPANPPGMTVGGFGTLTIRVMSFTGTPVPPATVTLLADMGEMTGINPVTRLDGGDYTYFFSTLGPGRYAVVVNAAGFQASRQTVELTPESLAEELVFMLKPVGADGKPLEIPPSAVLTPKSQKEMQNAMKDLQLKKFDSAQKHLLVAFQSSPGNAQINYLLGMTYVWMDQADKGKPYLEKAVALNPKHLESLLALGNLRCREGDFAGGTTLLESAIVLAPTAWQPHQTLAYAYLQQREFAKARDNADRAFELGKEKATGAQLLQAQALLGMGDKPQATTVLTSYLQDPSKGCLCGKVARLGYKATTLRRNFLVGYSAQRAHECKGGRSCRGYGCPSGHKRYMGSTRRGCLRSHHRRYKTLHIAQGAGGGGETRRRDGGPHRAILCHGEV